MENGPYDCCFVLNTETILSGLINHLIVMGLKFKKSNIWKNMPHGLKAIHEKKRNSQENLAQRQNHRVSV